MYKYEPGGKYFEEFEIGEKFTSCRRTVLDCDVNNFSCLTGDFNPIHVDDITASEGPFGERIAQGSLGVDIMNGQINQLGIFEGTTIAKLEETNKFIAPLYIGDTIHSELEVLESKPSSKGGKGIITCKINLINQDEKVITESTWKIMLHSNSN